VDHRPADDRFTGLGSILVIFGEAPIAAEPSEGPLDDPPFGKHVEAFEAFKSFDHLQADVAPGPQGPHPGSELTPIGLIGPNQSQARTLMPQDREETLGTVTVLDTGGRHHHRQEQA
jgi:hypothetical protein